jgi:hypothetical protein
MDAASSLNPQGASVSLLEPPVEPAPLSRFLIFVGAVALAVVTFVGVVGRAIAARWRGILLTHIFFLTLWLALQVFLFAKDAVAYLGEHVPIWFSRVEVGSSPSTSSSPPTSSAKPSPSRPVVTNCWRDRSLDGDCFGRTESHRKITPHRLRIPEPPPCRRFYMCDDI